MNTSNHSYFNTKLLLFGSWIVAMTGCTTYVQETPVRTVYSSPPPPPPPIEQSEPPPIVAAPPPIVVAPPADSSPDQVVLDVHAESDFYKPLAPYGEWVDVASYGRCWRPRRVDAGWRPYCNGYWQRTDAGWFWATDEPWGWATYHYGRWDWTENLGWIWVPQTQWAPSWVAWREGAGYVGWAPLPPSAVIAVSGGVTFRDAAFAPRAFVFVEERRVLEPVRPATVMINNTTVINKTVNITKIQVVNKTVINEGPRPEVIERVTGRRIQPVAVRELRHRQETAVVERQPNLRRKVSMPVQPGGVAPAQAERRPERQVAPLQNPPVAGPVPSANPVPPPAARIGPQPQRPKPPVVNPARETLDHSAQTQHSNPKAESPREKPVRKSPAMQAPQEKPAPARPIVAPPKPGVQPVEKPVRSPKEKAAVRESAPEAKQKHPVKQSEKPENRQSPGITNSVP